MTLVAMLGVTVIDGSYLGIQRSVAGVYICTTVLYMYKLYSLLDF